MPDSFAQLIIYLCELPLRLFMSRNHRFHLSRQIMDHANGDNILDLHLNGESRVTEHVAKYLAGKAAVVFDVGANVGDWTSEIAPRLDPSATVYSFEPTPLTFNRLCENVKRINGGAKIITVNSALGNTDGTAEIFDSGNASTNNSLYRRTAGDVGVETKTSIRIQRGEQFCRENGITHIDFLKIDVEGHEMAVLNGFGSMLTEGRIGCIQFEYGGAWIDSRTFLGDAYKLLPPAGYVIGKVHPGGVRLIPQYISHFETFQFSNYLALGPMWRDVFPRVI